MSAKNGLCKGKYFCPIYFLALFWDSCTLDAGDLRSNFPSCPSEGLSVGVCVTLTGGGAILISGRGGNTVESKYLGRHNPANFYSDSTIFTPEIHIPCSLSFGCCEKELYSYHCRKREGGVSDPKTCYHIFQISECLANKARKAHKKLFSRYLGKSGGKDNSQSESFLSVTQDLSQVSPI